MYWTFQHFFSNDTDVNTCSEEESPCACSWSLGWLESTTHELVASDEIQDSYVVFEREAREYHSITL